MPRTRRQPPPRLGLPIERLTVRQGDTHDLLQARGTGGEVTMSPDDDHLGLDLSALRMLEIDDGERTPADRPGAPLGSARRRTATARPASAAPRG